MSRGNATIEGLPHLRAALAAKVDELRAAAIEAVASEVVHVRDDAARIAPHKTGALRAGIIPEPAGLTGTVRSIARHAGFVEHGTYNHAAQPYMAPAAALARRRFPKVAAAIIRKALGG